MDTSVDDTPVGAATNERVPLDSKKRLNERSAKNALLIINLVNPHQPDTPSPSLGTEKDINTLDKTFKNFGFDVTKHSHIKKSELNSILEEYMKRDFGQYSCIGVVVTTSGITDSDYLLTDSDHEYANLKIIDCLLDATKENRTLWGKPKFYISSLECRRHRKYWGYNGPPDAKEPAPHYLPEVPQLLQLHSCGEDCVRVDQSHGTFLVQALCTNIQLLADSHDLEFIFNEVRKDVLGDLYGTFSDDPEMCARTPVTMSTLISKLYLRRNDLQEERNARSARGSSAEPATSVPYSNVDPHCSCQLKLFKFLKRCLQQYVAENPEEVEATNYLMIAESYEDSSPTKQVMMNILKKYFQTKGHRYWFKYECIFDNHEN